MMRLGQAFAKMSLITLAMTNVRLLRIFYRAPNFRVKQQTVKRKLAFRLPTALDLGLTRLLVLRLK